MMVEGGAEAEAEVEVEERREGMEEVGIIIAGKTIREEEGVWIMEIFEDNLKFITLGSLKLIECYPFNN